MNYGNCEHCHGQLYMEVDDVDLDATYLKCFQCSRFATQPTAAPKPTVYSSEPCIVCEGAVLKNRGQQRQTCSEECETKLRKRRPRPVKRGLAFTVNMRSKYANKPTAAQQLKLAPAKVEFYGN